MKLGNYVVLMVVGIVAMAFVPLAPCRANWVYGGSGFSSGAPDSDDGQYDGYESEWNWDYEMSGIDRGGPQHGCIAALHGQSLTALIEMRRLGIFVLLEQQVAEIV